jgi:hypothetical protein
MAAAANAATQQVAADVRREKALAKKVFANGISFNGALNRSFETYAEDKVENLFVAVMRFSSVL